MTKCLLLSFYKIVFHQAFIWLSSYSFFFFCCFFFCFAKKEDLKYFHCSFVNSNNILNVINLGKSSRFGNLNRDVYLFVFKCCIVCMLRVHSTEIHMYICHPFHTQFTNTIHSLCKLHKFKLYPNTQTHSWRTLYVCT